MTVGLPLFSTAATGAVLRTDTPPARRPKVAGATGGSSSDTLRLERPAGRVSGSARRPRLSPGQTSSARPGALTPSVTSSGDVGSIRTRTQLPPRPGLAASTRRVGKQTRVRTDTNVER